MEPVNPPAGCNKSIDDELVKEASSLSTHRAAGISDDPRRTIIPKPVVGLWIANQLPSQSGMMQPKSQPFVVYVRRVVPALFGWSTCVNPSCG